MQELYGAKPLQPPRPDPEAEGPRAISKAVEKNRGLTPHRRKDIKNPRVKVRLKINLTLGGGRHSGGIRGNAPGQRNCCQGAGPADVLGAAWLRAGQRVPVEAMTARAALGAWG